MDIETIGREMEYEMIDFAVKWSAITGVIALAIGVGAGWWIWG